MINSALTEQKLMKIMQSPNRRKTAIRGFAYPYYLREIGFEVFGENHEFCSITIFKWGAQYKRRSKKPRYMFRANHEELAEFFNAVIPELYVIDVWEDEEKNGQPRGFVTIYFTEVDELWKKTITKPKQP